MNIKFLLIGTSLSLIPLTVNAQCVATQDCATLGYTETSCNGGKGVKCPFGNKWACFQTKETIRKEIEKEICSELGFILECKGTEYAGGASKACGGLYNQCTCASGYIENNGKCEKASDGPAGDLYYCKGKVVGVKAPGMSFYIAVKKSFENSSWNDAKKSCQSYSFCGKNGTMPSTTQLQIIYDAKPYLNDLLETHGGKKLSDQYFWSTSSTINVMFNDIVSIKNGSIDYDAIGHNAALPILTSN